MSLTDDLVSHVFLPNTIEDLKRRLGAGRETGWYESNTNCSKPEKRKLSSEKSNDHRKSHSSSKDNPNTLCKETNNKFSCVTGNSTYVNSSNGENLSWDSVNKVIKDKVQCPDCGKVFFNEVKLPENFLKIYANSIANNDSSIANSTQTIVAKPIPSLPNVSEPQRYECYICDRVFSQKENYTKHLKKHMNKASSSKMKCDICHKSFSNQTALFNHFLEHKANTCAKCGKTFPDKWKYERHYKTHLHKCHLCEKLFVKEFYLKKHLASNHEIYDNEITEKPLNQLKSISNNDCQMIVSVKPELEERANTFVVIKAEEPITESVPNEMSIVPYVAKPAMIEYKNACDVCGKTFKDKWKLKQHMVIHSGERAWACTYCTQRFYFKYGLSRHVKNVHLSKEPTIDLNEAVKKDVVKQE